jgi:hypothetical protein
MMRLGEAGWLEEISPSTDSRSLERGPPASAINRNARAAAMAPGS